MLVMEIIYAYIYIYVNNIICNHQWQIITPKMMH